MDTEYLERKKLHQQEVDANYTYFKENEDRWYYEHSNAYVLLKGKQAIGFYGEFKDAIDEALNKYRDAPYSIQKIREEPLRVAPFREYDLT